MKTTNLRSGSTIRQAFEVQRQTVGGGHGCGWWAEGLGLPLNFARMAHRSPLGGGLLGGVLQKQNEGRRANENMQKTIEKNRAKANAAEEKAEAERKAAKSAYDAQRRIDLADRIKAEKAAWHKRTYDPVKAAEERKKTMARHVAYCRTPEYKAKKSEYDKRKKFEAYGAFADAARLLEEVEREISARATRYEIYIANGRYTRSAQQRRRELWQTIRSNRT